MTRCTNCCSTWDCCLRERSRRKVFRPGKALKNPAWFGSFLTFVIPLMIQSIPGPTLIPCWYPCRDFLCFFATHKRLHLLIMLSRKAAAELKQFFAGGELVLTLSLRRPSIDSTIDYHDPISLEYCTAQKRREANFPPVPIFSIQCYMHSYTVYNKATHDTILAWKDILCNVNCFKVLYSQGELTKSPVCRLWYVACNRRFTVYKSPASNFGFSASSPSKPTQLSPSFSGSLTERILAQANEHSVHFSSAGESV